MPFSNGQEFRRIRNDLVAKLVSELLIGFEAHAHRRGRSVIGVALKLIDQIVARVVRLRVAAVLLIDQADVVVAVDQCRNHGLARQIHASRVCRRLPLALFCRPK